MKKAPSQKQLKYMSWETGMFFHFGIRTFNHGHRDWDEREMSAETFLPDKLDCEQWIRTAKEFGAKYTVMTTKHHDGFANWPSKFTNYSVASSPWKNGKGDVVKEYTDACRKYGMAVGLYYSPAQWGKTSVSFENDREYDDYFIGQITELLSNYGKIDYLWLDECGSGEHKYDEKRIVGVIRSLQPEILIFNMWDPDTHWGGNEDGYALTLNNNTRTFKRFGESVTGFLPDECDFRLRDSWFYDLNERTLKSVDELIGIYEMSIGRGANMLINVGPDDHGVICEPDIRRLMQLKAEIARRYSNPLHFDEVKRESDNRFSIEYSPEALKLIADTVDIPIVRSVIITEDISDGGSVRRFRLLAHIPSRNPISDNTYCVFTGETIGRKFICRFPAIRAPKFTLEILDSEGEALITSMKAFE